MRVSGIRVNQIRVNQGLGVVGSIVFGTPKVKICGKPVNNVCAPSVSFSRAVYN